MTEQPLWSELHIWYILQHNTLILPSLTNMGNTMEGIIKPGYY